MALVVGCFSTALLTAATLYQIPAARLSTELMLGRLQPFQDSNRIPVTIVDTVVPELTGPDAASTGTPPTTDLSALVGAVGYTVQSVRYGEWRPVAVDFLARHAASHARYVKRRRLTRLDLPGRLPVRPARDRARHLALVRAIWPGLRRPVCFPGNLSRDRPDPTVPRPAVRTTRRLG